MCNYDLHIYEVALQLAYFRRKKSEQEFEIYPETLCNLLIFNYTLIKLLSLIDTDIDSEKFELVLLVSLLTSHFPVLT